MRVKLYITLGALLTTLSFSSYASLPATTPSAASAKASKLSNIGDSQIQKTDPKTSPNSTNPQEQDKQNGFDGMDPNRLNAFIQRYNSLPSRSTGWCGRGTRESAELLTGHKYDGANGGELWKQLLKTGLWREAYPGEDLTGKIVVRSLQNNGYGHAECLVPDPYNPSQCLVSSDFKQIKNFIDCLKHFVYRNLVPASTEVKVL